MSVVNLQDLGLSDGVGLGWRSQRGHGNRVLRILLSGGKVLHDSCIYFMSPMGGLCYQITLDNGGNRIVPVSGMDSKSFLSWAEKLPEDSVFQAELDMQLSECNFSDGRIYDGNC